MTNQEALKIVIDAAAAHVFNSEWPHDASYLLQDEIVQVGLALDILHIGMSADDE